MCFSAICSIHSGIRAIKITHTRLQYLLNYKHQHAFLATDHKELFWNAGRQSCNKLEINIICLGTLSSILLSALHSSLTIQNGNIGNILLSKQVQLHINCPYCWILTIVTIHSFFIINKYLFCQMQKQFKYSVFKNEHTVFLSFCSFVRGIGIF